MASSETACVRAECNPYAAGVDSRHANPIDRHLAALMSIFARAHLSTAAPKQAATIQTKSSIGESDRDPTIPMAKNVCDLTLVRLRERIFVTFG
jgi:hypothetical protein